MCRIVLFSFVYFELTLKRTAAIIAQTYFIKDNMTLIPAATVVILRKSTRRPKVLLVHRNPKLPVMGDLWVFPGGRFSLEEKKIDDPLYAAKQCAIRETEEETGLRLSPEALTPLLRWITPEVVSPRFDAWFFIAIQDTGKDHIRVDGREIVSFRWATFREGLEAHHQRQIMLSPPAYVVLSRMAAHKDPETIFSSLNQKHFEKVFPVVFPVHDGVCAVYKEDVAYTTGKLYQPGPRHRLWMRDSGWHYESAHR
ncbi:MAG: NUDIX hydrolase [Desulfobacteraceae bacterium]|nr:NUDIX hydrolase [Desulfobacteraceae bacterium]